jgi:hypothetical protein
MRKTIAWLIFAALVSAYPAFAETLNFTATLKGSNEVPPNQSEAKGDAELSFDTDTKLLSWTVNYSGLSGAPIGAHIHGLAEPGGNAGIMIPFTTLPSPIKGSKALNSREEEGLMTGRLYVNVHTKLHPGGEIRGQILKKQ